MFFFFIIQIRSNLWHKIYDKTSFWGGKIYKYLKLKKKKNYAYVIKMETWE